MKKTKEGKKKTKRKNNFNFEQKLTSSYKTFLLGCLCVAYVSFSNIFVYTLVYLSNCAILQLIRINITLNEEYHPVNNKSTKSKHLYTVNSVSISTVFYTL